MNGLFFHSGAEMKWLKHTQTVTDPLQFKQFDLFGKYTCQSAKKKKKKSMEISLIS